MSASYPSAAKSFTSRVAGDTIQPAHVNDLQDEVTAIETNLLQSPTSYTPTLTNGAVGNGTITGSYWKVGKLVTYQIKWTLGSTSTVTGNLAVTLPTGAADSLILAAQSHGWAYDSSGSAYYPLAAADSGSLSTVFPAYASTPMAGVSTTVPFTWATGDILIISGTYFIP